MFLLRGPRAAESSVLIDQSIPSTSDKPAMKGAILLFPKACLTKSQIHIDYELRPLKLQQSEIEAQVRTWKASSNSTLFDQLHTLSPEEQSVLHDATKRDDYLTYVEWVHFSDFNPLIRGMESTRARTITLILHLEPLLLPLLDSESIDLPLGRTLYRRTTKFQFGPESEPEPEPEPTLPFGEEFEESSRRVEYLAATDEKWGGMASDMGDDEVDRVIGDLLAKYTTLNGM
ncbi:Glucose-methanol-choline oxidoreductase N-terminal [Penicillium canescens]|uniref:Glucose-methanol-choline oxidoreductase N-terminal n=1 Tax=Penicillium canescens TaxID=5083 RepID=A0AAD6I363_PENCN|nr:Glucose-methanol-choline oxidoreductase N-terminal [Penicillium canescens]KAJ6027424.1 Glucose-methanol-choline oxidoreductase N-terminal [Penicillium canescens]KAJ6066945.1 Glucose-methanol-choline oxidoreductase N-terminal [Penicillium canescens]